MLFSAVLLALLTYRRGALSTDDPLFALLGRLPQRFVPVVQRVAKAFAEGIAWPGGVRRGVRVVFASVAIKLLAATHMLWAGLSIGIVLEPAQYLFLVVFLGFLMILSHFLRFIGSFVVGGVFALGLFSVTPEPTLAMLMIVEMANILSIAGVGAISPWAQCIVLRDLRAAKGARR